MGWKSASWYWVGNVLCRLNEFSVFNNSAGYSLYSTAQIYLPSLDAGYSSPQGLICEMKESFCLWSQKEAIFIWQQQNTAETSSSDWHCFQTITAAVCGFSQGRSSDGDSGGCLRFSSAFTIGTICSWLFYIFNLDNRWISRQQA